jgi:chromosome segregation ATPase
MGRRAVEPQQMLAQAAMPQAAQTLSSFRAVVRQIPRTLLILSSLGALAAGIWAFLCRNHLFLATALALEVMSWLGMWLDSQWRENADLASRMDRIANNALQQGAEVLEDLQHQNQELSGALQELRQTNAELRGAIERMSRERAEFVATLQQTDAELLAFRTAEQDRLSVMEEYRVLTGSLREAIGAAEGQVSDEAFWGQTTETLESVLGRVEMLLQQDQSARTDLSSISQLAAEIQTLRSQLSSRSENGPESPLQAAIDRTTWLLSDLSQRLLNLQTAHVEVGQRLDAATERAQRFEQAADFLRLRCEALEQRLQALTRPQPS